MAEPESAWWEVSRKYGPYIKLAVLFVLLAILSVVLDSVAGLVHERKLRRDAAVDEISRTWGGAQAVTGPLLVIPYRYTVPGHFYRDSTVTQSTPAQTKTGFIYVLPETLKVDGTVAPVERY
ncbi:MAG: inner membrane CreD family protein, partial [Candidatus Eiseniibacteriota bacterium]